MKIPSAVSSFFSWLKKIFWTKPVTPEPEPKFRIKAQELNIQNFYTVIEYKGQRICLNKAELAAFHSMNRDSKRKVLEHWRKLEKKGHIRFETINGQLIAIRNKDYASKADNGKPCNDKA